MANSNDENGDYGPEFEVCNHLHSGLELARGELRALDPKSREAVESLAENLVSVRKSLVLAKDREGLINMYDLLLEDVWFRHAAEIKLGDK